MASENVKIVSDNQFDSEVMQGDQLTVVDFWAEWCGPCRMLGPTIEALADQYAGKVKVFKMNVDENPQTPAKFHIRGIPTVIFFKGGEAVETLVGNQPKETLSETIDKHLT